MQWQQNRKAGGFRRWAKRRTDGTDRGPVLLRQLASFMAVTCLQYTQQNLDACIYAHVLTLKTRKGVVPETDLQFVARTGPENYEQIMYMLKTP